MPAIFTGPYVDPSLTTQGPFTNQPAPVPLTPFDATKGGPVEVYTNGLTGARDQYDFSAQAGISPQPENKQFKLGYDPYATGGA